MGLRSAGERNPFFSALPACLFPHFTSHGMLLQLGRDLPCEALQEQGTDLLGSSVARGAQIPSALLEHGAQTQHKVTAGGEVAVSLL